MLEVAIHDNPEADIIIKTHPDTLKGSGCYYKDILAHDNIYKLHTI
jgi:capsule polysaccharide export protein KpsC/LpsZ